MHYYWIVTDQFYYIQFLVKYSKKKFFKHISRYLTLKKNICEQQCGFINGTSTDISVAKLLKHVDDGLDANKFGTCVFLGNCKAFDMVNKGILLSKLFTYGIRGLAYQLLCSYLENQQQYVTIISTGSSTSPIGMGVPQGSNLGTYYFWYLFIQLFNLVVYWNLNCLRMTPVYTSQIVMNLFSIKIWRQK